jgi:adenine phosphoribosyltransferase
VSPAASEAQGLSELIASRVRDIEDFPKPGVTFKDITPVLDDHVAFTLVIDALAAAGRDSDGDVLVDKVVGMEARGFILAAPVALSLGVGFVPVRKPGKLPWKTRAVSYDLEYGSETLEMHVDALQPGDRVLVIDDVLATGGTAKATAELVEQGGGTVHGLAMMLELSFLPGRAAIGDLPLTVLHVV